MNSLLTLLDRPDWRAIAGWLGQRLSQGITPSLGSQLYANGNLEAWSSPTNASGWVETLYGDGVAAVEQTTDVHSGSYAAKLTSGPGGDAEDCRMVYTTLTGGVTPGRFYRLSLWTKGDGTHAARMFLYNTDAGTNLTALKSLGVTGGTYTEHLMAVWAPFGCSKIGIYVYSPDAQGYAFLDNVLLQEVQNPDTLRRFSHADVELAANMTIPAQLIGGLTLNADALTNVQNCVRLVVDS